MNGSVFRIFISCALFCLVASVSVRAHQASDSYLVLQIREGSLSGQWDIALRDLDAVLRIDGNDDGTITWPEIRARQKAIFSYATSRLQISSGGISASIHIRELEIGEHVDGLYAVLRFDVPGFKITDRIGIDYKLLFDTDPQHRGLLRLEQLGASTDTAIFSPTTVHQEFKLEHARLTERALAFISEGIWHIWTGFDHILFLLALLLPSVLKHQDGKWGVTEDFRGAAINVLKVVTAFTLAHSITLSLATLGVVTLPSRLVEGTIAASVMVAALNNLKPFFSERAWMVAFGFGLIHGFGFASVLQDLGLPRTVLAGALLGFNIGVEIGQLCIVLLFLPLAFSVRRSWFYREATLRAGSVCIASVSGLWLIERVFAVKILPF